LIGPEAQIPGAGLQVIEEQSQLDVHGQDLNEVHSFQQEMIAPMFQNEIQRNNQLELRSEIDHRDESMEKSPDRVTMKTRKQKNHKAFSIS
jgi:hypothetical protein